jgi:glycerate 2-kinase
VRVLVASDSVGSLTSSQAGRAIASGWSAADVRVLPVGDSGAGFARAYADLLDAELEAAVDGDLLATTAAVGGTVLTHVSGPGVGHGLALTASSRPLGDVLAGILREQRPDQLVVDLSGLPVHDAGAGLLAALGADADQPLDSGVEPLGRLNSVDLSALRALLGHTELVGVVPAAQLSQPLLGLRGITSLAGRAAGLDPADLLATDAALERFAKLTAPEQAATPGAGACGGLGFGVLALGGQLTTGPALAFASSAGLRARSGVELVVTGCSVFDFARRGGGVVAAAAELAAGSLSPCVLIAGEVVIGAREMRAMGIEAAYPVRESALDVPTGEVTEDELQRTAVRVARSWHW